jgi:hypothetical protein
LAGVLPSASTSLPKAALLCRAGPHELAPELQAHIARARIVTTEGGALYGNTQAGTEQFQPQTFIFRISKHAQPSLAFDTQRIFIPNCRITQLLTQGISPQHPPQHSLGAWQCERTHQPHGSNPRKIV